MRILVTGGAGFIGSNLALKLEQRFSEAHVTIIDDLSSGTFRNLQGFKGDLLTANLTELPLDFNPSYDYVFHLASISDTRVLDEQKQCHNNIEGFRAVLSRVFAVNKDTRVVYASSASVYGVDTPKTPFKETQELKPENVYAFTKVQLENLARALLTKVGLPVYGVRFFNVYGPGEGHKGTHASMIRQLAKQARKNGSVKLFADGTQERDFVHVDDATEIMISLMDYNGKQPVFNCGSGVEMSFNTVTNFIAEAFRDYMLTIQPENEKDILAHETADIVNREYVLCPYPFFQKYTCADMSLAKQELGFEPKASTIHSVTKYIQSLL